MKIILFFFIFRHSEVSYFVYLLQTNNHFI